MFTFYKSHNNSLYNKLVELSRNNFFYQEIKLPDNFETRALLIFFHLAIIFKAKKDKKFKKVLQNLFDNVFQNIEINIRELGYGDTKVNNTMKTLNQIFYDILGHIEKRGLNNSKDDYSRIVKAPYTIENSSENIGYSKALNY